MDNAELFVYVMSCPGNTTANNNGQCLTLSHASWKVLESSGIPPYSRASKFLEVNVGSGNLWKFDVKVLKSS